MARCPLSIPAGESRTFSLAGVPIGLEIEPSCGAPLRLPASYAPFLTPEPARVAIRVGSRARLEPVSGALLFESKLHWRAVHAGRRTIFQFHHPPTALHCQAYCQAIASKNFTRIEVRFSEAAWRGFSSSIPEHWELPYPLDQLVLVPVLALRGAVLLHACGAVISNRGLVFAGHSGDGKTTLARLLSEEGVPLLSDERIAVRRTDGEFVAFGTPWPGEGNVVSNAAHPLAAMFLLRKAPHHALGFPSSSLVSELLARAIVPYYLPRVAARILSLFSELAFEVPFRELRFARSPGLSSLLRDAA